jgi:YesN/AraC family two-component response regulator
MNHLRMDEACQLLLYSSLSVKEVADQSGFANEHYYSRLFTKIKGLSATAFRERYTVSSIWRKPPTKGRLIR